MELRHTSQDVPASPARRYHHVDVILSAPNGPRLDQTLEALRILATAAPADARITLTWTALSADWSSDTGER